jgi:purine nucleoside phosphorylase
MMHRISYDLVSISAQYVKDRTKHRPKTGIICGSGLGRSVFTSVANARQDLSARLAKKSRLL